MNENLHLDDNGYELVIGWGGKRNHSYLDDVRIPTIGTSFVRYTLDMRTGHKVYMGDTMTDEEVEAEFLNQIKSYKNGVKEVVKVPLTQSQFNACVSLCCNINAVAFAKSAIVRRSNERKYKTVCDVFTMWNKTGGRVIPSFTNRQSSGQKGFFRNGQRLTEILEATSDSGVVDRYFCCAAF